jgi:hypothetical protein
MLIEEGDGGGGYERSLLQSMLSKSLSIEVTFEYDAQNLQAN